MAEENGNSEDVGTPVISQKTEYLANDARAVAEALEKAWGCAFSKGLEWGILLHRVRGIARAGERNPEEAWLACRQIQQFISAALNEDTERT